MKNSKQNTFELRKRIRNIMSDKKITVKELCSRMSVNRNYLNQTEHYTIDVITSVSKALNVSIYDLIEVDGWVKSYNEKGELFKIEKYNV